jgi:hypothetical protein
MRNSLQDRLIAYLQTDLNLSQEALSIVLKRMEPDATLIPVMLWQYGLISLSQFDQILDWLETA